MRRAFVIAVVVLALSLAAILAPMALAGQKNTVKCHNHHNNSTVDVTLAECNQIAIACGCQVIVKGNHAHVL